MTFIIDLDDTLVKTKKIGGEYKIQFPMQAEINAVNRAYNSGHTIIIYTGRGWDKYYQTICHLKEIGVKYNQLIMGRPQGIFIDSTECGRSIKEFLE